MPVFRVCNHDRSKRKLVFANTVKELLQKGMIYVSLTIILSHVYIIKMDILAFFFCFWIIKQYFLFVGSAKLELDHVASQVFIDIDGMEVDEDEILVNLGSSDSQSLFICGPEQMWKPPVLEKNSTDCTDPGMSPSNTDPEMSPSNYPCSGPQPRAEFGEVSKEMKSPSRVVNG